MGPFSRQRRSRNLATTYRSGWSKDVGADTYSQLLEVSFHGGARLLEPAIPPRTFRKEPRIASRAPSKIYKRRGPEQHETGSPHRDDPPSTQSSIGGQGGHKEVRGDEDHEEDPTPGGRIADEPGAPLGLDPSGDFLRDVREQLEDAAPRRLLRRPPRRHRIEPVDPSHHREDGRTQTATDGPQGRCRCPRGDRGRDDERDK